MLAVAQQTVNARQTVSDQVEALFKSKLRSQLDFSFAAVNLAQAKLRDQVEELVGKLKARLGTVDPAYNKIAEGDISLAVDNLHTAENSLNTQVAQLQGEEI